MNTISTITLIAFTAVAVTAYNYPPQYAQPAYYPGYQPAYYPNYNQYQPAYYGGQPSYNRYENRPRYDHYGRPYRHHDGRQDDRRPKDEVQERVEVKEIEDVKEVKKEEKEEIKKEEKEEVKKDENKKDKDNNAASKKDDSKAKLKEKEKEAVATSSATVNLMKAGAETKHPLVEYLSNDIKVCAACPKVAGVTCPPCDNLDLPQKLKDKVNKGITPSRFDLFLHSGTIKRNYTNQQTKLIDKVKLSVNQLDVSSDEKAAILKKVETESLAIKAEMSTTMNNLVKQI